MSFLLFQEKTCGMDPKINELIKNKRALVVEDESAIAQLLKLNLEQLGFETEVAGSSETALEILRRKNFDLCLLDWMLPGMQGLDALKVIRPKYKSLKVIMITAKADADSIVSGFENGADDYLTKPFEGKVLGARVRNLMRRSFDEAASESQQHDGLSVDLSRHIVKLDNREVHLTPSEFKLLAELFKARGKVLTRDQLIDLIQGADVSVTGRTIDTHVFSLRKKIGSWSQHIETIRGVGYRILLSTGDTSEKPEDPA
jgi:two-component system phosphate regulon response regulator PhoB